MFSFPTHPLPPILACSVSFRQISLNSVDLVNSLDLVDSVNIGPLLLSHWPYLIIVATLRDALGNISLGSTIFWEPLLVGGPSSVWIRSAPKGVECSVGSWLWGSDILRVGCWVLDWEFTRRWGGRDVWIPVTFCKTVCSFSLLYSIPLEKVFQFIYLVYC